MRDDPRFEIGDDGFRRFFDAAVDMLCIADVDGFIRLVNPAWERVLGWTPDELCGRPYLDFVHPDDAEATIRAGEALTRGDSIARFTNRYRCRDGCYRDLEWSSAVRMDDGLIYATVRDVTEERRARTQLEEMERITGVGGWEVTVETGGVRWSPMVFALHDLEVSDRTPDVETALSFYPPEARVRLEAALERLAERGEPYDLELPFVTAKGRVRCIRTTGAAERRGERIVRLYGAFQDITELKRDALRLSQILHAANAGTWEWSVPTGALTLDALWAGMLGYTVAELEPATFDTFDALVHPDDRAMIAAAIEAHFSGRTEQYECAHRMRHRDGRWLWILALGRVVSRLPDGSPELMVGAHIDIDARKRQEAELEAARARMEATLAAIPDFLFEFDAEGRYVAINSATPPRMPRSPQEMIGKRVEEVLPPEVVAVIRAVMADVDATGSSAGRSYWRDTLDGRRCFEVSATRRPPVPDDPRPGYLAVLRDITDRKEQESELAAAHSRLQATLAAIPDVLLELDADRRYVGFHCSNPDLLVAPPKAFIGKKQAEVLPPDVLEVGERVLDEVDANGRCVGARYRLGVGAGERWFEASAARRPADALDPRPGYIFLARDITERQRQEEELRAAREEAEAASRAKSSFLANMSHEIRTPLNGVLGMADALDRALTDPEHRRMIGVVRQSGELLLKVINDVLDLSKIEAGRMELEIAPFAPREIARSMEAAYTLKASQKNIAFSVSLGGDVAAQRLGDAHRIAQILHNLLGNAMKFTEAGAVSLDLSGDADGWLRIEVRDTGIGMTAEQIARVFDPFTQADVTVTRRFGGSGLGMSIVKRLVDLMKGEIAIDSTPGEGVHVSIGLPAPLAEAPAAASEGPADASAALDVHALAADDNEINRLVLEALLATLGVQVTILDGGRPAVEACRGGAFDVLLLDISMPDMDGVTALGRIRAEAEAQGRGRVPAIAVTANAMSHHIAEYLDAGFDAHVAKPIDPAVLGEAIRSVCAASARVPSACDPVG